MPRLTSLGLTLFAKFLWSILLEFQVLAESVQQRNHQFFQVENACQIVLIRESFRLSNC